MMDEQKYQETLIDFCKRVDEIIETFYNRPVDEERITSESRNNELLPSGTATSTLRIFTPTYGGQTTE
jgi:hypothetical protein